MNHWTVWPAPAKLNLFLYINGRRDDGYHELQTMFQLLDYGDSLKIRVANKLSLKSELDFSSDDNLIIKAAKALQLETGCTKGAEIILEKNIPLGGGLGGGSSDAATTLVALNYLWGTNLTKNKLSEIGVKLGADIPIFIHGNAAFAEGIGEKLTPIDIDEPWYLVVDPKVHINTKEIFNHPDLTRNTKKKDYIELLHEEWRNDFQPLVISLYPKVAKALDYLLKYAPSRLSGSGSCLFGTFKSYEDAQKALSELPLGLNAFIAKGKNKSPLEQILILQAQQRSFPCQI